MEDLVFIGGEFFDFEIPKEKRFLLKYFKTPLELQFLRYYLCFNEIDNFVNHTGFHCQRRWLIILKNRFEGLVKEQDEVKNKFDGDSFEKYLERLAQIEKGKVKIGEM